MSAMLQTPRFPLVVLAVALLALVGCTGGKATTGGKRGTTVVKKRDPINPKAAKDFESAMRALRLGGPEAAETAKARLKSALEADKTLWEAWHDLGVIAYKDGDDDVAIDAFGKALAVNAAHIPTLLARAEAHRRAGHKDQARADYQTALATADEDDPNRKDAATRLASLLRDAGDYDAAVEVIRESVRLSGTSSKIYTELGLVYIAQKRMELAQLVLAKALEIDKTNPATFNALAILALRQGHAQEAFGLFDQAVSLDPTFIDARYNKASVLLDAGDYARAKTELAAIVDKKPDDFAAHVSLGVAHRGLKEFPEAKRSYERVVKEAARRSPVRADALFDLALLKLDYMEDAAGGKSDLDRYLQDAPSNHSKRQIAEEKRKELK